MSTQDNAQLLQRLESGFKRTINLNKFYSKPEIKEQNPYLDHFIDLHITRDAICFLPKVKAKDYNFMSDMRNIFDQYIKGDMKAYENIRKVVTGQGDHFRTGCILDFFLSQRKL